MNHTGLLGCAAFCQDNITKAAARAHARAAAPTNSPARALSGLLRVAQMAEDDAALRMRPRPLPRPAVPSDDRMEVEATPVFPSVPSPAALLVLSPPWITNRQWPPAPEAPTPMDVPTPVVAAPIEAPTPMDVPTPVVPALVRKRARESDRRNSESESPGPAPARKKQRTAKRKSASGSEITAPAPARRRRRNAAVEQRARQRRHLAQTFVSKAQVTSEDLHALAEWLSEPAAATGTAASTGFAARAEHNVFWVRRVLQYLYSGTRAYAEPCLVEGGGYSVTLSEAGVRSGVQAGLAGVKAALGSTGASVALEPGMLSHCFRSAVKPRIARFVADTQSPDNRLYLATLGELERDLGEHTLQSGATAIWGMLDLPWCSATKEALRSTGDYLVPFFARVNPDQAPGSKPVEVSFIAPPNPERGTGPAVFPSVLELWSHLTLQSPAKEVDPGLSASPVGFAITGQTLRQALGGGL